MEKNVPPDTAVQGICLPKSGEGTLNQAQASVSIRLVMRQSS